MDTTTKTLGMTDAQAGAVSITWDDKTKFSDGLSAATLSNQVGQTIAVDVYTQSSTTLLAKWIRLNIRDQKRRRS